MRAPRACTLRASARFACPRAPRACTLRACAPPALLRALLLGARPARLTWRTLCALTRRTACVPTHPVVSDLCTRLGDSEPNHRLSAVKLGERARPPARFPSLLAQPRGCRVRYRSRSPRNPIPRSLSLSRLLLNLRRRFLLIRIPMLRWLVKPSRFMKKKMMISGPTPFSILTVHQTSWKSWRPKQPRRERDARNRKRWSDSRKLGVRVRSGPAGLRDPRARRSLQSLCRPRRPRRPRLLL